MSSPLPLEWSHQLPNDCDMAAILDLDHVLCEDREAQSTCVRDLRSGRCTMEEPGNFLRSIRVEGRDLVALFSAYPHVIGARDGVEVKTVRSDSRRKVAEYPQGGGLVQSADGRCTAWATSNNAASFDGGNKGGSVTAAGWAFASPVWVGGGCVAEELVMLVDAQVVTVSPDGTASPFGPEARMWSSAGGCLAAWRVGEIWMHCDGGESTIEMPPGIRHWSIVGTPAGTRYGWLILTSLDVPGVYALRFDSRTGSAESAWYTLPMDHPVRSYEPAIVGRHVCVPSLPVGSRTHVPAPTPEPLREPVRCFVAP